MRNMTKSAQDALNEINNQDFRQRLCLWVVIVALFMLNILVIVVMINNNGKLYSTTSVAPGIFGFHQHEAGQHQKIEYIPVDNPTSNKVLPSVSESVSPSPEETYEKSLSIRNDDINTKGKT